jgi:Fic family protein
MADSERHSVPGDEPVRPPMTDDERAAVEARNGLRQYDRMTAIIGQAVGPGPRFRMRPSTIMELNRIAVDGIEPHPGAYRQVPITISASTHQPPAPEDVPLAVDEMCEYVQSHLGIKAPVHLAAYVMWRLNWIHPFVDGNGRTSRVMSHIVLCVSVGQILPGLKSIPERIAESKRPYYSALDSADAAWKTGILDVSKMEELLSTLLAAQLSELHKIAVGAPREDES